MPSLVHCGQNLVIILSPIPANRGHEGHHQAQRTRSLFQKNTDATDFTDETLVEFHVVNFVPLCVHCGQNLIIIFSPIPANRGHEDHHEAQRTRSLFQKNTDETDGTDFTDKTLVEFHVVNFVHSLCSWWPKFNNNLVPNSSE